jgi:hypothetical protein
VSITVAVKNEVDPLQLLAVARKLIGNPAWDRIEMGPFILLRAQGRTAVASVHHRAGGGDFKEDNTPRCYALVVFQAAAAEARNLMDALTPWLDERHLAWVWSDGDSWKEPGR